jgi:hypothetical protein
MTPAEAGEMLLSEGLAVERTARAMAADISENAAIAIAAVLFGGEAARVWAEVRKTTEPPAGVQERYGDKVLREYYEYAETVAPLVKGKRNAGDGGKR